MLVLTIKPDTTIRLQTRDGEIRLVNCNSDAKFRVGIDAPKSVDVVRSDAKQQRKGDAA